MRKKSESTAPEVTEVAPVEAQQEENAILMNPTEPEVEVVRSLSKFEKQLGLTEEDFSNDYNPSTDLKIRFAGLLEFMHNNNIAQGSPNQSRYNDITRHIMSSFELAKEFVK